jgi:PucR C-terminal helix-turn-helix domain/GGDEF-like domain
MIRSMLASLETRLADELDQNTTEYAELVLDGIAAEVPDLLAGHGRRELARTGSQALLREFSTALRHELGSIHYHAPTAALAYSRHLAREGVSLAAILRSYRLGQEVLFARAAELALEEPSGEEAVQALARIGALSFRFSDGAMTDVAHEYETQRELFIRGTLAQRSSILAALLAGRAVDVAAAERTLSHRLDGAQIAIVAWSVDPAVEGDTIAGAVRELVRTVGQGRPLVVTDTDGEATIWTTPAPAYPELDLAALLPPGMRAAIGRPGTGVDGFVASKRQADLARTVAATRAQQAVTFYDDVALAAVLLRDRDAARAFATEELGELMRETRAAAELRDTLSAFFANGHDQSRTADVLGVHRNTIAKRLRRAEAALERTVTSRPRELEAALLIAEVLAPHEEIRQHGQALLRLPR